jgi:hypothetical protein
MHSGWDRADRTSANPSATAFTRKCQAGTWASRRRELYRALIAILRPSLKIMVAKPCSVLFPRIWDWVEAVRRICRIYHAAHGFYPSLIFPLRYTEKIQWRKLFDLNPLYIVLCDKLAVRDFISERVGSEFLVPLLWTGNNPEAIPFDALIPPYIVKSTHSTAHTIIVEDRATQNEEAMRKTARAWLEACHGTRSDEIGYVNVPHRLVAEELLLQKDGSPPIERKFFVFHGIAKVVRSVTMCGKNQTPMVSYHTSDWTQLPWKVLHPPPRPVNPPRRLDEMIRIAERLAAGLEHVRVDMYECDDEIYVGEMALYPFSGHHSFQPDSADFLLGSYWDLRPNPVRDLWTILTKRREICRPEKSEVNRERVEVADAILFALEACERDARMSI